MQILYCLLHSLVLAFLVFFWKRNLENNALRAYFYPALIAKMLACVAYSIVYLQIYKGEGDTVNYFKDVSTLVNLFYQNPTQYIQLLFGQYYSPDIHFTNDLIWRENRMFIFVKICSIFQIIVGNDYRVMSLYMTLLSFWGNWYLCNKILIIFKNKSFYIALCFLFLPSALIWSSGYSKESIVMWAFGIVIGNCIGLFFKQKFSFFDWFLFVLGNGFGLFVLFLIKFYYVASLVPALFAGYFTYIISPPTPKGGVNSKGWQIFTKFSFIFVIYVCAFALLVVPLMYLHPAFWFENLMLNIVYNHNVMYLQSSPEDLIHYSTHFGRGYINLDADILNMLYNTPKAFFSIVFRPFIWESYPNKLKILASIENFLLLVGFLFVICNYLFIYFFKKNNLENENTISELPAMNVILFVWSMFIFVVILYTLLALASPNLGSLSRYRVVGHSWVWFFLCCQIKEFSIFSRVKKNN